MLFFADDTYDTLLNAGVMTPEIQTQLDAGSVLDSTGDSSGGNDWLTNILGPTIQAAGQIGVSILTAKQPQLVTTTHSGASSGAGSQAGASAAVAAGGSPVLTAQILAAQARSGQQNMMLMLLGAGLLFLVATKK